MKIQKIDLKHIWTYSNFIRDDFIKYTEKTNQKTYELWKLNLFYWENWSWKSTLSKLLRLINWESTIENDLIPWWSSSDIDFTIYDNSWNSNSNFTGKIKIFDKEYIKKQVGDFIFEADESTEQNKSRWEHFLLIWDFLSKEKSIQDKEKILQSLETKLKEKIGEIEKKDSELKQIWWEIYIDLYNNIITNNLSKEVLEWNLSNKKKDFDLQNKINIEKENISKMADKLVKLPIINNITDKERLCFSEILYWAMTFNFNEKDTIKKLIEITNEQWLDYCLLCNQSIQVWWNKIERIKKLIDDLLIPKVDNISSNLVNINTIANDIEWINSKQNELLSQNKNSYDIYKQIKSEQAKKYPNRDFALSEEEKTIIISLKEFIKTKQSKLSEKVEIWDITNKLNQIILRLNHAIETYNKSLVDIDVDIEDVKSKANKINDIQNIQKEIVSIGINLSLLKEKEKIQNFIQDKKQLEQDKENIETQKGQLETEKGQIKKDFSDFTQKHWLIIEKLIETINPWLARKINFNLQWTYSQWKWRCGFEIKHSDSSTTITKHLSDWEKRSIAFAYFLSQFFELNSESNLELITDYWKDFMVVFDDPSTDYDKNNKAIIANIIVDIVKWFEQVFVLTHDEKFRDYIIKQTDINPILWDIKRYKITKNYLWKSFISIFDKDQIEIYHALLLKSLADPNPDLSCTAHALRYCVENMICNSLLWESESSVDNLVKNKLGWKWYDHIKKANDKNKDIRTLYTFCNNNWSHYWEADWFEPLAENINKYFEIYDYIFNEHNSKLITRILPVTN